MSFIHKEKSYSKARVTNPVVTASNQLLFYCSGISTYICQLVCKLHVGYSYSGRSSENNLSLWNSQGVGLPTHRSTLQSRTSTIKISSTNFLTLILRRSRTEPVCFYTSTSNKRAARPKLYTKSLTRDLKRMYSRFTGWEFPLTFRHRASSI